MEQFSGADLGRLIWKIVQRETRLAFQNNQLIVTVRLRFEDHGRASDPDRHRFCRNLSGAGILARVEQDRAAVQPDGASRLVEAKDRVRTETRNCQIGKGQFRARIVSRSKRGAVVHFVVNRGRTGVGLFRQKLDVVKNGGDVAFRFRRLR
jgi:hypothetical protein